MISANSIFYVPLFIIEQILELYLMFIGLRLILGWLSVTRHSRLCLNLMEVIDPIVRCVNGRLSEWRRHPIPIWWSWAAVIVVIILLRQVFNSVIQAT